LSDLTTEQKKLILERFDFVVGVRDLLHNTNHPGAYMVAEVYEPGQLPTKDGSCGPWCVVGDDLVGLIAEGFDHLVSSTDNAGRHRLNEAIADIQELPAPPPHIADLTYLSRHSASATLGMMAIGRLRAEEVRITLDYMDGIPAIEVGPFAIYRGTDDSVETPDLVGQWLLEASSFTPGRSHMPNGDLGYPADSDSSIVDSSPYLAQVIYRAVMLCAETAVQAAMTNWAELQSMSDQVGETATPGAALQIAAAK
jgi:hypothetical protein